MCEEDLGLSVKHLCNLGEVGESSFLAPHSHHLVKETFSCVVQCNWTITCRSSSKICRYIKAMSSKDFPNKIHAFVTHLISSRFQKIKKLTWGGLITNFFFSPATMSGFLSLMIPNTLWIGNELTMFLSIGLLLYDAHLEQLIVKVIPIRSRPRIGGVSLALVLLGEGEVWQW